MTKDRLAYLLEKYLDHTATSEEVEEYNKWYEQAGAQKDDLFTCEMSSEALQYKQDLFQDIDERLQDGAKIIRLWTPEENMVDGRLVIETGRLGAVTGRWEAGAGRRILGKWVAAASLMLLAAGIWIFQQRRTGPQGTIVTAKEPAVIFSPLKDSIVSILNNTPDVKDIRLKDGSAISLYANSEVRFINSFGAADRKVYLTGKAFFEVAKDQAHPFMVYSHSISTTALGTSFTVTAYPGVDRVEVLLKTGKVMVKQAAEQGLATMKAIYLLPGQAVDCRIAEGIAELRQPQAMQPGSLKKPTILSYGSRTGWAAGFEQASLATVLDSIGNGYRVSLEFDPNGFSDILFSGRIREKDSLSQVLQRIASLHDLEIKPNARGFSIRKNH